MREGTAILSTTKETTAIRPGCLVLTWPEAKVDVEPEGLVHITELRLLVDYAADMMAWAYRDHIVDRLHAHTVLEAQRGTTHILRLGSDEFLPTEQHLDELSQHLNRTEGGTSFFAVQAKLSQLLDTLSPHLQQSVLIPQRTKAGNSNYLRQPLRNEARQATELLHENPAKRWRLNELAAAVHLSPAQLSREFTNTYGTSPLSYLTRLRVQELARLLRDTNDPIELLMRQVGWNTRGHAARYFRQHTGMTPSEYRKRANRWLHMGSAQPPGGQYTCCTRATEPG